MNAGMDRSGTLAKYFVFGKPTLLASNPTDKWKARGKGGLCSFVSWGFSI